MRQAILCITLSMSLIAAISGGWYLVWAHNGRSAAENMLVDAAWAASRERLRHYLWLHPQDAQAHLMVAESFIRDGDLPVDEAVPEAIGHLQQIPESHPLGAEARLKEARVRFLVLHQPYRAEKIFRRALELDPSSEEGHYLLWKLLDLTSRSHQAEDVFWRTYERTPESRRPIRLREWYMSQFFPITANPHMDHMLGFIKEGESPTKVTEHNRLLEFRNREPNSPAALAGLARWFQMEGNPQFAWELLQKGESLEAPFDDADYVATLVAVLFELGKFQEAAKCFEKWPEPHGGNEYWKWRGIIHEEVYGENREALQAYDQAFAIWPGPVDWRMQNRRAHCLKKLGQHERAREARQSAKSIERLMGDTVHERLRSLLGDLGNPNQLEEIVEFYRKLERTREAECWSKHIERLRAAAIQSRIPDPS